MTQWISTTVITQTSTITVVTSPTVTVFLTSSFSNAGTSNPSSAALSGFLAPSVSSPLKQPFSGSFATSPSNLVIPSLSTSSTRLLSDVRTLLSTKPLNAFLVLWREHRRAALKLASVDYCLSRLFTDWRRRLTHPPTIRLNFFCNGVP